LTMLGVEPFDDDHPAAAAWAGTISIRIISSGSIEGRPVSL
jgi:hypothetical protein